MSYRGTETIYFTLSSAVRPLKAPTAEEGDTLPGDSVPLRSTPDPPTIYFVIAPR